MKIILALGFCLISTAGSAQKNERFIVHFDYDKFDITPATAVSLDSFMNTLPKKLLGLTIRLLGHCDSIGSNEYNDVLSQNRCKAVAAYFLSRGIPDSDLVLQEGFGKRVPLNQNASAAERAVNRRVEINFSISQPQVVLSAATIKKTEEKTITKTIEDSATVVGSTITLHNLNFIGGRHVLLPEAIPVLEDLLHALRSNPRVKIAIEGHVCCVPGDIDGIDLDLNTRNLSETRAKAVYDYLVQNGIDPERLSYKGLAHRFPITAYPETSEAAMEINRRVEIRIVNR